MTRRRGYTVTIAFAAVVIVALGAWLVVATMSGDDSRSGSGAVYDAQVAGYWPAEDPQTLTLRVLTGRGDAVRPARVEENGKQVRVAVQAVRSTSGSRGDIGIPTTVTIQLKDPLGTRPVVDEQGQTVPRTDSSGRILPGSNGRPSTPGTP
ncbi:hypothetical protein AB0I98_48840 [Streptomyces sp. NPDC050211]|uniref:hypothetical protein n=1 Tax=Streptomyces sp. NPDC050211 TaxID=3154932 RepID=UPI003442ABE8